MKPKIEQAPQVKNTTESYETVESPQSPQLYEATQLYATLVGLTMERGVDDDELKPDDMVPWFELSSGQPGGLVDLDSL